MVNDISDHAEVPHSLMIEKLLTNVVISNG